MSSLAPVQAFAGQCPSNATEASYAMWARGQIPHDQNRSAMLKCGKHVTCNGGDTKRNLHRTCHWD
jgi:hypothetical protein